MRGCVAVCLALLAAPSPAAQVPPMTLPAGASDAATQAPAPPARGAAPPATSPAPPADAPTATERPRERLLPSLDVYFPEGDLDFRLNRLIKNAFFEGQVKYNFVKGDITAFLRYRYYGYDRTYQIGFFDAVEFSNIERFDNDFERVRGGLLLMEWPHDYHQRTFFLVELDSIYSNKEDFEHTANRTNTYLRLGHQIGTPDDARSNAIVGETRARIERLFTAYRNIGPHDIGWTGAMTYGFDQIGGDFSYVKGEFETLTRVDFPRQLFLIARLHGGTFLLKDLRDPSLEPLDRYSIPRTEFFRLDGRENLKGIDDSMSGTEELHTTLELFFPWFRDQRRRFVGLEWDTFYGIVYGGYGTVGFDRQVFTDPEAYVPDVGLGFESSFRLRDYSFFLSAVVAQALEGDGDPKLRVSIKSFH
jgi:hypothetical protein